MSAEPDATPAGRGVLLRGLHLIGPDGVVTGDYVHLSADFAARISPDVLAPFIVRGPDTDDEPPPAA